MAPKDTSYYDLLEVCATATPAEIRKAYRLKALQHHPDRAGNTAEATSAFQHLKAVYETLSDPDKRAIYDEDGPSSNIHGDEEDDLFNAESLASFFKRQTNPVTADDILAYEQKYRNGKDEQEDLISYFERFQGDVKLVLEYIPYSEKSDIERFIRFWDEKIEQNEMNLNASGEDEDEDDGRKEWKKNWLKSRKHLSKICNKVEPRDLSSACTSNDIENIKDEDEDGDEAEAKTKKSTKQKKKQKKKQSGNGTNDGMDSLIATIQARQQRTKSEFDDWANRIEQESKSDKSKKSKSAGRSNGKRNSQGSPSELRVEGGVRKNKRKS